MTDSKLEWSRLLNPTRRKSLHGGSELMGTGIDREEVERDYDRVLFAAPTRRLADKTQVFPQDRNDSVRTRLTHSHEVSNLGRSIGVKLAYDHRAAVFGHDADALKVERTVPALLAAVGLAHDLGNPPFGHQGEKSMRQWCRQETKALQAHDAADFNDFDGNCQTFRLLTRLQVLNDNYGYNLTCATLAALMKYPVFSKCLHGFKKFGLFESERDVAEEVWKATGLHEGIRHPLAYIMEACDDIAYSVIDAEDTVKKRYASFNDLVDVLSGSEDYLTKEVCDAALRQNKAFKKENLAPSELDELSMQMFRVKAIAKMVQAVTNTFVSRIGEFLSADVGMRPGLVCQSDASDLCHRLKNFDRVHGFNNTNVLRLELQGHSYITKTMDWLWRGVNCEGRFEDYIRSRISENYKRVYKMSDKTTQDKLHLVCDAVAGMTDRYLVSMHDDLAELER